MSWYPLKVKVKITQSYPIVIPWIVTCHAPLSMEFSRQEYWSGLPFPPPEDLPNPGIKPRSAALQAFPSELPGKPSLGLWNSLPHKIALSASR